jgi:exodeoxyribonuclease VII large subunit
MDKKIYSVSQLNKYIKMLFDTNNVLSNISIQGEITNFKAHYTGHLYFTLKDESSSIKCIMFKSYADSVKFKIEDGLKVVVNATVSVYEKDGTYQLYCKSMSPVGIGDLYLAFEQLKEKLKNEGLFEESRKRDIPFLPKRVGVITSKTGAVIKDIINVATRRYNKLDLLIYPAAVQGVNVASSVIAGLNMFNKLNNVDVIIIARGGGSFEDLFGFNDEKLAYEIFNSKIPVISAVGHETDFTICDFVADLRAPTPSAAAELVFPQLIDIVNKIDGYRLRNVNSINNFINLKKEYIKRIYAQKLEKIPLSIIDKNRVNIDKLLVSIENNITFKLENSKSNYLQLLNKIDTLSPLKTLLRGYSVVQNSNGNVITSNKQVKLGENLKLTLASGKLDVVVK